MLRQRSSQLLPRDDDRIIVSALRRRRLRRSGSDISLVAVTDGQHDAHPGAEVVKDVLDRSRRTTGSESPQVITEILALVADVHAGVPAPFRLLLSHLGAGNIDL